MRKGGGAKFGVEREEKRYDLMVWREVVEFEERGEGKMCADAL